MTVWVCPGQGSQQVGMGSDLYRLHDVVRETLDEAGRMLEFDLPGLIFRGPASALTDTAVAQPALYALSVAIARCLRQHGAHPGAVAGHSLGEYSALTVAGSLSFADGLRLVRRRGVLMATLSRQLNGGMISVGGLPTDRLPAVLEEGQRAGIVELAAVNSAHQVVLSGTRPALEEAGAAARRMGAFSVKPLEVSGPFHSSLMSPVREALAADVASVALNAPDVPVVMNVTGRAVTCPDEMRALLLRQITETVRWADCMTTLLDMGDRTVVEVGPGRVLAQLVRSFDPTVPAHPTGTQSDLLRFLTLVPPGRSPRIAW